MQIWIPPKTGVAVLISGKVYLRTKKITRDGEGYYVKIKRSIHQEQVTILNLYAQNNRGVKHVKQKLRELKETNCNCIWRFQHFLSTTDRTRQKSARL